MHMAAALAGCRTASVGTGRTIPHFDVAISWTMAVKGKKLVCNVSIALWQFSSGNTIQSSVAT